MGTPALQQLLATKGRPADRAAVVGETLALDHRHLLRHAERWAMALHAHGLPRGARVAVLAEGHPEVVALMLGLHRAGLVCVPINPRYREAELRHVIDDSGAALLLCDRTLADERLDVLPASCARRLLPEDPDAPPEPDEPDGPDGAPLPRLPSSSAAPPPNAGLADDETALLVYTSGTTGRSKGVRLSLGAVVGNIGALTTQWRWSSADVLSLSLPLFHVHGLCIGIYGALLHGMTVLLHRRFEPSTVVTDVERGATVFMGVPTMYDRLLEHVERHPEAAAVLARARLYTAGSAALRPAMLERWEALTGHRILERYGMTETLITLSNPYEGERRPGSVGRPVPGCEARVVDEAGRDVARGELGELWVRGPFLMQGYWKRPRDTEAAFTDGWFRTGDVVVSDPDGYLRIVGRRSTDIIKSGGFKIAAPEIEEVLLQHPAVREVAVVGVPDHRWGERIAAAVVPVPELPAPPEPEVLVAWVAEHLADYKKPRQLVMVDELPRNALGKVQKPRLVQVLRRPDDPDAAAG
ncbi:AMP-binding protein [Paraliomyxa miuraensis]|uniref:AMP-binding protein n=1 Tax=Paraliomyxa miuraensis TaxID=376150 RepID=UPI00225C2C89|nr:AMP-binding protein [Paraliomyxa miuraensis]MCX4245430.1 AMP-binding protein [Paraliomyxa miuraensis]